MILNNRIVLCFQVKKNCKLFAENALERFNLFVKAFSAEDNISTLAFISQAKSLVSTGAKLLQRIKTKQVRYIFTHVI